MTEHGPRSDDPAAIPFREPLGPPMTHEQLVAAYQRRERCEAALQEAEQRIIALEAALALAEDGVRALEFMAWHQPGDHGVDDFHVYARSAYNRYITARIAASDAARAGADAGETLLLSYPTGQMATGRVVASGERPPLVIVDDGADAEEE